MESEKQDLTSANIKNTLLQKLHSNLTVVTLIVLFVITSGLSFFLYPKIKSLSFKSKKDKETVRDLPTPSKDILFLTSPVYQIPAKVESVSQNKIVASNKFSYSIGENPEIAMALPMQPTTSQETPTPPPTPITKEISFEIEIDEKTIIERQGYYIPLLFPPENYNPNKFDYTEIKNGDLITITTKEDLRTIKDNKIKAIRISLPPIQNIAEGKIIKIENNKIEVNTEAMMALPVAEPTEQQEPRKSFSFIVDQGTEISYMPMVEPSTNANPGQMPEPPKPVKLDLNSLREGERVRIYTKGDILKSSAALKAERIEPLERK